MNQEELLHHLESLASSLGIRVTYEVFSASDWHTSSGLCLIKEEPRILIDKRLPLPEKVSALALSLKGFDFDSVYCPPIVRKLIEEDA
jgi:hypothetical protein